MLQSVLSLVSDEIFCLTLLQNFVGEPLCGVFSRKILVAKKFMDKSEGEAKRFPFNIFCLTVPKNAVGDPLVFH